MPPTNIGRSGESGIWVGDPFVAAAAEALSKNIVVLIKPDQKKLSQGVSVQYFFSDHRRKVARRPDGSVMRFNAGGYDPHVVPSSFGLGSIVFDKDTIVIVKDPAHYWTTCLAYQKGTVAGTAADHLKKVQEDFVRNGGIVLSFEDLKVH